MFEFAYSPVGDIYVQGILHSTNKKFTIAKFQTDCTRNGPATRAFEKTFYTTAIPKLSHHVSGVAQISGKGIISGFSHLTNNPKGAFTPSISLGKFENDGGPVLCLCSWGIPNEILFTPSEKDLYFSQDMIFQHKIAKRGDRKTIIIEGYYVLKEDMPVVKSNTIIEFDHPYHGKIKGVMLAAPNKSPGTMILTMAYGRTNMDGERGYYILGGPGVIDDKGMCSQLGIFYPGEGEKMDSLDFKGINKLKIITSDKIGNILDSALID